MRFAAKVGWRSCFFAAASEGFSLEEYQPPASLKEAFGAFRPHPRGKRRHVGSIPVRAMSLARGEMPFDGAVDRRNVAEVADACFRWAAMRYPWAIPSGQGTPDTIARNATGSAASCPAVSRLGRTIINDTQRSGDDNIDAVADRWVCGCFDAGAVGGTGGMPLCAGCRPAKCRPTRKGQRAIW